MLIHTELWNFMSVISNIWKILESLLHIFRYSITELLNFYYFVPLMTQQKYTSVFFLNFAKVKDIKKFYLIVWFY